MVLTERQQKALRVTELNLRVLKAWDAGTLEPDTISEQEAREYVEQKWMSFQNLTMVLAVLHLAPGVGDNDKRLVLEAAMECDIMAWQAHHPEDG